MSKRRKTVSGPIRINSFGGFGARHHFVLETASFKPASSSYADESDEQEHQNRQIFDLVAHSKSAKAIFEGQGNFWWADETFNGLPNGWRGAISRAKASSPLHAEAAIQVEQRFNNVHERLVEPGDRRRTRWSQRCYRPKTQIEPF